MASIRQRGNRWQAGVTVQRVPVVSGCSGDSERHRLYRRKESHPGPVVFLTIGHRCPGAYRRVRPQARLAGVGSSQEFTQPLRTGCCLRNWPGDLKDSVRTTNFDLDVAGWLVIACLQRDRYQRGWGTVRRIMPFACTDACRHVGPVLLAIRLDPTTQEIGIELVGQCNRSN